MTTTHTRSELTEALLGQEIPIAFVSLREAVRLHDDSILRVGGTPGVRDTALLESALHRPMMLALYDQERDVFALAASLGFAVSQNHAFLDGNKRTAFLSTMTFLAKNGHPVDADVAEAVEMFVGLAAHNKTESDLRTWLEDCWQEQSQAQNKPEGLTP